MIKRYIRKALKVFFRYQLEHEGPTIYEIKARLLAVLDFLSKFCQALIPIASFLVFGILVYDAGFNPFYSTDYLMYRLWYGLLVFMEVLLILFFLLELKEERRTRSRVFNLLLIMLVHAVHYACNEIMQGIPPSQNYFIYMKILLYAGTLLIFLTEASAVLRFIYQQGFNPAFLFVSSFFMLICVGALLLLLPNATTNGIKPVDAWFTAASAVCVTGLTVVDTSTAFTHIGQLIILALIQLGGLGIMTFAGLLSYLSAGSVSFRNQLALRDMLSSSQISSVISLIGRVVVVTLFFEAVGAFIIFQTLDTANFPSIMEKIYFSIFHAISAFCNAGFSTYSNGLYELPVRFNYSLQLIIALLIVLGGTGFPIVFALFTYIRAKIGKPIFKLLNLPFRASPIHLLNTTSRLALMTTLILIAFGFTTYFLFELNMSLREHPTPWGKFVTSLFGAITPRTAGFNTVNLAQITLPTIMIYLLLMWIGASPGSTGGGIKTTVIAVAFLNMRSIVLGKERTEISQKQIGENSIQRAFAIILLSLLVIGVTVLILSLNEPDKQLFAIAFEAFSAFSTVGLTLGITPDLSITSKIFLSIVMLTGRVGTLTMLFAFVTPARTLYYRYPKEEISL